ncbi:heptosyltransferase I [Oryzomicrobium terrae]|uniref:Lipopolysaccharide heptosyltransferase 1 n=1 Tax=Oryzomicrobium terrae TaxID=1735038 RepID=A0A5C1ECD1_9RHOO|nr:lipopolysaccharide heptosyltransferase I [Oryzomicrobium terrae]QEL66279.1 heptosyltransferase I [Oryzomicrobium terrae]
MPPRPASATSRPSAPPTLLLVKTSSLGDVIHNLPVVSDLRRHFPGARIDWCVEEGFQALPGLHPGVAQVIPVAVRRWRKHLLQGATWGEIGAFRRTLRETAYDAVLDTQGLVKSALIARQARGPKAGYAPESAREPLAAHFYNQTYAIPTGIHAVTRNRWLAAAAFGYAQELELLPLDYGIAASPRLPALPAGIDTARPYAVLLTATSRDDKLWPEDHWIALGRALLAAGLDLRLPGGSARERERAGRIAAALNSSGTTPPNPAWINDLQPPRLENQAGRASSAPPRAEALPASGLAELAAVIGVARLAVGVDTGLTHLAAALNIPTLALFVATDPGLTGVLSAGLHANLGGKAQCPDPRDVAARAYAFLAGRDLPAVG